MKFVILLIGFGAHMTGKLLPALKEAAETTRTDIEIGALCRNNITAPYKIDLPLSTDFFVTADCATALANPVNAAIISLPDPNRHAELAELAILRNIPTFVEKPAAHTLEQSRILASLTEQKSTVTAAVGFNLVFMEKVKELKTMVPNITSLTIDTAVKHYPTLGDVSIYDIIHTSIYFALSHSVALANNLFGKVNDISLANFDLIDDERFRMSINIEYSSGKVVTINYDNNSSDGFQVALSYEHLDERAKLVKSEVTAAELKKQRAQSYRNELADFLLKSQSGQASVNNMEANLAVHEMLHRIEQLVLTAVCENVPSTTANRPW